MFICVASCMLCAAHLGCAGRIVPVRFQPALWIAVQMHWLYQRSGSIKAYVRNAENILLANSHAWKIISAILTMIGNEMCGFDSSEASNLVFLPYCSSDWTVCSLVCSCALSSSGYSDWSEIFTPVHLSLPDSDHSNVFFSFSQVLKGRLENLTGVLEIGNFEANWWVFNLPNTA